MLRVLAFFAMFTGLAFSQLQTSNKIELTDLQCIAVLTDTQYRGTQGLWAKMPRESVSQKPELFGAILPGSAKFEWIVPVLPSKGSEALAKILAIGADRWVVFVPQKGLGCDLRERGGQKTVESSRVSALVHSTQASSPAMSEETRYRLEQVGLAPLLPIPPAAQSTTRRAVVIIDSGIRASHPELYQKLDVSNSVSFVGGNPFSDENGHGTAVAEIIAGRTAGFVSSTPVISYRVLDTITNADGAKVLVGSEALVLRALLRLHSLPHERLVVNMSLQFSGTPEMWRLAIGSLKSRATFVVSAGNAFSKVESSWLPCSLSDLENLICVGGTDASDRKIGFSNYGPPVKIGAPAVVATSLGTWAGTSFSAPQVTGTTSLILEQTGENFSPATLKGLALSGRFSGYLQGIFDEPLVVNTANALEVAQKCATGKCSSSSLTPFVITGVEGTWSGSSKFTYGDLVTIKGQELVDRIYERGEQMPVRVLLNGYDVEVLSATPESIEVVLPSAFRGNVWAQAQNSALNGESILALVRVVDGVPVPGTATIATRFRPEIVSPAVGFTEVTLKDESKVRVHLVYRSDGLITPENPVRAGDKVQIFISGIEIVTASQEALDLELGGSVQKLTPLPTTVPGVYVVTAEVPTIRGIYGLFGKISARGTFFEFGVNYVGPE